MPTAAWGKPVLQFLDGTQIMNPRFFYKIHEGYGFGASKRVESLASGSSIDFLFLNPSGSSRNAYVSLVEIVGLAQLYADIYVNNTITSNGTAIPILNLHTGSNVSPSAQVYYNGTYTLGSLIYNTVVPGGSKREAIGGLASIGESVIVVPGTNFILRVTNASASDTDLSVRVLWWEDPI